MFYRITVPPRCVATLVGPGGAVTRTFGPGVHWGAFTGRVYVHTARGRFAVDTDRHADRGADLPADLAGANAPERSARQRRTLCLAVGPRHPHPPHARRPGVEVARLAAPKRAGVDVDHAHVRRVEQVVGAYA